MRKGILKSDVTNTVLDRVITLGSAGERVYIHEEQTSGNALEVSTENNPSSTFWARVDQVEVLND